MKKIFGDDCNKLKNIVTVDRHDIIDAIHGIIKLVQKNIIEDTVEF